MPAANNHTVPQDDNLAHALAGLGGGVLSTVLTYPLITLSTRAQVESKKADSRFTDAVRSIVAREGLPGLYAGINTALFGISVTNFIYYYWYEYARAFFTKPLRHSRRKLTALESILAGALAGSATVIITNPIWVINTRITTRTRHRDEADSTNASPTSSNSSSSSALTTLISLLRNEGPQALFAGLAPALILVINPILQYTLFEQLRNAVEKRTKITPTVAFFLGALGKLFATTITYPYITLKSQMHVVTRDEKRGGMVQALRRLIADEGFAGLYKGIGPKVTQSVLTAALLFAFKDALYDKMARLRLAAARRRAGP